MLERRKFMNGFNYSEELMYCNSKLNEIKEKIRVKKKLRNNLDYIQESLANKKSDAMELKKVLDKELHDVQILEGYSISALIHKLLGDKDEKLIKERQEYIAAKIKYDESINAIKRLEIEMEEASVNLKDYMTVEREYDEALKVKEKLIEQGNDENSIALINIDNEIEELHWMIKEVNEAIQAGEEVEGAILDMKDELEDAEQCGRIDMFGGGLLTTIAKHSHIDSANSKAQDVKYLLERFAREMKDINVSSEDINVKLTSVDTFGDYFFDGFIFDHMVQQKIYDADNNVTEVKLEVQNILYKLENQIDLLKDKLNEALEKKRKLIEDV